MPWSRGDDLNHLPPSLTPILQLDGDAPNDDDLDHDYDDPDRNLDDDAPDNDDDEDTVFNAVICQHTIEECSNELYFNLNYMMSSLKMIISFKRLQNLHQLQTLKEMSKTFS